MQRRGRICGQREEPCQCSARGRQLARDRGRQRRVDVVDILFRSRAKGGRWVTGKDQQAGHGVAGLRDLGVEGRLRRRIDRGRGGRGIGQRQERGRAVTALQADVGRGHHLDADLTRCQDDVIRGPVGSRADDLPHSCECVSQGSLLECGEADQAAGRAGEPAVTVSVDGVAGIPAR